MSGSVGFPSASSAASLPVQENEPGLFDLLPAEQILPILECCALGETDNLKIRLLSKKMKELYETTLDSLWNRLKQEPRLKWLKGFMAEIEEDASLTTFTKFQLLHQEFEIPIKGQLRVTVQDFLEPEQKLFDVSLLSIWPEIKRKLPPHQPITLTAQVIRSVLNHPQNAPLWNEITVLELDRIKLKVLPPEIAKFRKLKHLHLRVNQLRELPDCLNSLEELIFLDASDNKLATIPDLSLKKLEILHLHDNNFKKFHCSGGLKELRTLDLGENRITECQGLGHLTKLTELSLGDNQLRDLTGLSDLQELKLFSLYHNQFIEFPGLKNLTKLQSLNIFGNPFLFISVQELERFKTHDTVKLYQEELNYPAKGSLALFYQMIMRQRPSADEIREPFKSLPLNDQHLIYDMAWELSGKPSDDPQQWGEKHAFDVMETFYSAVQKTVLVKFERLSQNQKDLVSIKVWEFSGQENSPDSLSWGRYHAKNHLPLLANLVTAVIG